MVIATSTAAAEDSDTYSTNGVSVLIEASQASHVRCTRTRFAGGADGGGVGMVWARAGRASSNPHKAAAQVAR